MKIWKVFNFWFVYLFFQLDVSFCPDFLLWHSIMYWHIKIAECVGVFSPAYYYPVFLPLLVICTIWRVCIINKKGYLMLSLVISSAAQYGDFMDWSLFMMFWCTLYLCFGGQGFQSMSRPGYRLNACKQAKHSCQLNFSPKISDSHALRPLSKGNQSLNPGVIKRFISKEWPGSEL